MNKMFSTTDILRASGARYWHLEHLIRAGKIKPLSRGRGRERRFTRKEFEKAKQLLTEVAGTSYEPA